VKAADWVIRRAAEAVGVPRGHHASELAAARAANANSWTDQRGTPPV